MELSIPEGNGVLRAVTGELRYDAEQIRLVSSPTFTVFVHYTTDAAIIEKNKDWDTQAEADVALSTRAVEHAMHLLDEGRPADAERTLSEARQALVTAPVAATSSRGAAVIRDQGSRLASYSNILKEKKDDMRLAKKSIQFDNYQTQKKR